MATSLEGLFKTPTQVRADQQKALQEQGLTAAAMLTRGSTGSSTALPGLLQGFAGNIAANIPADAQNLVRGSLGAAGAVAGQMGRQDVQQELMRAQMSPEEQRAMAMKQKLRKARGDYEGLKALADEMIREGNAPEAYAILQMAEKIKPDAEEDAVNTMDTNDMKNIAAIGANQFQCDVRKDPQCFLKAKEAYIDLKRADTAEQQMEVFGYEGLSKKRDEAETAARSIRTANESLRLLDSGEVNVGLFPKTKQGAYKLASEIFGWQEGKEVVTRTATLMASTKQLAGELLSSGMFGSGTAISERDLLTAQEIAGAADTLTPESMKQILELNAKMNQVKIDAYNKKLDRYSPEFYARTPEGTSAGFMVEAPKLYESKNVGTETEEEMQQVIFDGMMFPIPKGAQAGKIKGRLVYKLNGKYYDGTSGEELTTKDLQ